MRLVFYWLYVTKKHAYTSSILKKIYQRGLLMWNALIFFNSWK